MDEAERKIKAKKKQINDDFPLFGNIADFLPNQINRSKLPKVIPRRREIFFGIQKLNG
jgi:hypothetical protein